jgi:peptidyl-prolyl cis-trans isomerase C
VSEGARHGGSTPGDVAADPLISPPVQPSRLRRWLHEPLLHFLAAGLALFITGHVLNPERGERDQLSRIELTENDLRQLAAVWTAQWGRPPTPEELRNLVEGRVREEVLYREALALGLERGDTIVKRRLAQKIQFLAEDVSGLRDPADEELRAWFSRNGARFTSSDRVSFRQLYFSFDQRGERARGAAGRALETLAASPNRSVARAVRGDPFIFEDYYGDQASEDVARVFGTGFAEAVFRLRPGAWQGPIESGFGWHVVWVDAIAGGRTPAYEEIEPAVRSAWLDEQRDESRRRTFDAMRARYQVVLPSARTKAAATGAQAAEKSP